MDEEAQLALAVQMSMAQDVTKDTKQGKKKKININLKIIYFDRRRRGGRRGLG